MSVYINKLLSKDVCLMRGLSLICELDKYCGHENLQLPVTRTSFKSLGQLSVFISYLSVSFA